MAKQGIWPGKIYSQVRHIVRQDIWLILINKLKEILIFYRTTIESCRKFMNISLANGNRTFQKF
jgi:hypothetical protein